MYWLFHKTLSLISVIFINKTKGKLKFQPIYERMQELSYEGLNYINHEDVKGNGESQVFKLLNDRYKDRDLVVFDVGANVGQYCSLLLAKVNVRNLKVYSFEPSQSTFDQLKKNIQHNKVSLVNCGFGDDEKEVTLYSSKEKSAMASIYNRKLDHFGLKMEDKEVISISTIDIFCLKNSIKHIDFLKIDVEGGELDTLKGAEEMIKSGAVDIIQFEFGGCNIDSKTFVQDFYYFLEGFDFYRLMRDGLYKIDKYDQKLEVFQNINFLAIRRS